MEKETMSELYYVRRGGRKVFRTASGADRIAACRAIVEDQSFAKIDGIAVDLFSASAIIAVYDALNEVNREKFSRLPIARMAGVTFKCLK
jgi:hypothetical protein